MRKLLSYLFALVLMLTSSELGAVVTSRPDSLKMAALDAKLTEYLNAISRESFDVQKQECDFLIGSTKDSLVRTAVARKILSTYMDSPVMGAETVAVHVIDNWFSNGAVKMSSDIDLLNARVFADFNRQSLIGCKAPDLMMENHEGQQISFPGDSGRYSVLYFYDADCAKCKIQSILIRSLFDTENYPIDFYAVYTGDDRQEWKDYIDKRLAVSADNIHVQHLWDPQVESDFQRKYGVLQTPRVFLVSPDGVILGRGLDAKALSQMFATIFSEKILNYGGEESVALFDMIFGKDGVPETKSEVVSVADHISESTLNKGDTEMFRQLMGDLMYYLSSKRQEAYKEGLDYVIDEYILSRPTVWRSQDDSLKIVGMARVMDDLLSKAAPDTSVPSIKVPGEFVTARKEKMTEKSLDKLGGKRNFIMFFAEGCNVCAAEKKAMRAMMEDKEASKGVTVFLVNVDEILATRPELASDLFDLFDLTSLPFILETDRKGVVVRRYISF